MLPSVETKPIILYDIPCSIPGRPWSPNTMRTRYCLGYKQLPFETVWVELPDIKGLLQSKGVTQPPYTLPAIEDPNTGALVVDSIAIASYLDEAYPETRKVLGPAARAALEEVERVFSLVSGGVPGVSAALNTNGNTEAGSGYSPRLVFLVLATKRLNPVSIAHYDQKQIGGQWTTLRDACCAGPEERAEAVKRGIKTFEGVWRGIPALYNWVESKDEPFALGKEPCLLDFAIAGRIKFVLDGLTPSEMDLLTNLEGGRLVRLVESLEKYYKY